MSDTEKLKLLIDTIKTISNAVNNESPDMALWEINRIMPIIESWETQ